MTVSELKKAIENLPDEMPVVYAWNWLPPRDICTGKRRGSGETDFLVLDGKLSTRALKYGNTLQWEEPVPSRKLS